MGESIDLQAKVSAAHSRLAFAVACQQECRGLIQIVQSWGASLFKVTAMSSLRGRLVWHKENVDRARSEIIKAERFAKRHGIEMPKE